MFFWKCEGWIRSRYVTKADLKKGIVAYRSNTVAKSALGVLKAEIDQIDVDKLKTVLVDFSKLSNVVENEVVKKSVSDKLVAKLDAFYTIKLVLRRKYDTENLNLEK